MPSSLLPNYGSNLHEELTRLADERLAFIRANEEKLVEAWLAETGLLPSDSLLEVMTLLDGTLQIRMRATNPTKCFSNRLLESALKERDALRAVLGELAIPGESPDDAARRIRAEVAALRGALVDVAERERLAVEAASQARDERDSIREVHRALEWLAVDDDFQCSVRADGTMMVTRRCGLAPVIDLTWAACARALGWEG